MKPKKNPKHDLNRYSGHFFSFGLALTLFLCWQALEWKKYDKSLYDYEALNILEEEEEKIPITEQLKTPPPPSPAPEIIKVVEDEEEVVETIIESTETDQEEEIVDVEEVDVAEEDMDVDVPFAVIEQIPLFPGCEKVPKSQQKKLFSGEDEPTYSKNISLSPNCPRFRNSGKVYVSFVIDRDGNIVGIRSRGPDKNLTQEAERIIGALPQMIPGKQRGKPVREPYSVPISFQLR